MVIEIALGIVLAVFILAIIFGAFKVIQEAMPLIELVLGGGLLLASVYGLYSWYKAFPLSFLIIFSTFGLCGLLIFVCDKFLKKLSLIPGFPTKYALWGFVIWSLFTFSVLFIIGYLSYTDSSANFTVLSIIFLCFFSYWVFNLWFLINHYIESKNIHNDEM